LQFIVTVTDKEKFDKVAK